MSSQSAANFIALILLGAAVGLIGAYFIPSQREQVSQQRLQLAAMVAVGATLGSLYFSEVANFLPCELCWFQRIFMYPLAVILPIAAFRKNLEIAIYAIPLAVIGLGIAIYHIQLELFPDQGSFCELTNPCTDSPIEGIGFMTIPQMSGLSFALIIALLLLFKSPKEISDEQSSQHEA